MASGLRRIHAVLANPDAYWLVQRMLGAEAVHRHVLKEHARVQAGDRVLDLGCGPGRILDFLPDVDYLGFDVSPEYIQAARRRYGARARFELADISQAELDGRPPFDLVLALGVLHHLDDGKAGRLMTLAAKGLGPAGRLVTLDPAFTPGQPRIARWLARRDRGRHVRTPEGYRRLAEQAFGAVEADVHQGLAVLPYTHAILECQSPLRS
jgi:SAM-dependent methyltransferase